ncbi:hypothetical protein M6B38_301715 [Iris pallida]|uniref:Uncharacterized protein n=1 Tax=Iris pallida TaxID=29817 RepID=A0AAX6HP32_IRIPA|nr:hypothetical protein M6B38_301715 [Iris pallida]
MEKYLLKRSRAQEGSSSDPNVQNIKNSRSNDVQPQVQQVQTQGHTVNLDELPSDPAFRKNIYEYRDPKVIEIVCIYIYIFGLKIYYSILTPLYLNSGYATG